MAQNEKPGVGILSFFKWTDTFSLMCGVFGFLSVIRVVGGDFFLGAVFLAAAGVFDYIDGFATMRFSKPTEFGSYIDTVCDAAALAMAPAAFIYFYALGNFPEQAVFYLLVSVAVLCAGLLRLARYLVLAKQGLKSYVGLPITFNALLIPLLYLLSESSGINLFFLALVSAFLMVSEVKVKKFCI